MSVSNVGSGASLYQFLQSLTANASPTQNSSTTDSTDSTGTSDGIQQTGGRHHHHKGGSQLFNQIASALSNALQGNGATASSAAGGTSDVNATITSTIASVLQGLGAGGTTPAGSAGTTPAAGATGANGTQGGQLGQLLSELGVTPQQFWSDFSAAIQQVQGSAANPSGAGANTLLANLAPGSVLDTTA